MENSGIFKTMKRQIMKHSDCLIMTGWYGEQRDFQNHGKTMEHLITGSQLDCVLLVYQVLCEETADPLNCVRVKCTRACIKFVFVDLVCILLSI